MSCSLRARTQPPSPRDRPRRGRGRRAIRPRRWHRGWPPGSPVGRHPRSELRKAGPMRSPAGSGRARCPVRRLPMEGKDYHTRRPGGQVITITLRPGGYGGPVRTAPGGTRAPARLGTAEDRHGACAERTSGYGGAARPAPGLRAGARRDRARRAGPCGGVREPAGRPVRSRAAGRWAWRGRVRGVRPARRGDRPVRAGDRSGG